jgi:arylsulfatase A-like enzyme
MTEVLQHKKLAYYCDLLLLGALVGSSFGLIDFGMMTPQVSRLPMASRLAALALEWYAAAAIGSLAALAFAACKSACDRFPRMRSFGPVWPGASSVAVCTCILLISGEAAGAPYWFHLMITIVALIAFALTEYLVRRYPSLKAPAFWGAVSLLTLFGFLLQVTLSGQLKHGMQPAAAWLLVPPLALSLVSFLRSSSRLLKRALPAAVLLLMLSLGLAWFLPTSPDLPSNIGSAKKLNVLLVTVDTLRSDHLGCYGSKTVHTPCIDRLAGQGVLFENTISPIPLTNPSHYSILTGRYPGNHGVVLNRPHDLASDVWTLPRILSKSGYKTAAFVSGFTLKRDVSRFIDEFELYDDDFSAHWFIPETCTTSGFSSVLLRLAQSIHLLSPVSGYERRADHTVSAARQWLRMNQGTPFFLWLHLFDPHSPYSPPAPYNKMYDIKYSGKAGGDFYGLPLRQRLEMTRNPKDLNHFKALYAGEVSYVDQQVGELLSEIDALHLTDRTLLILTADHGESLTEHNYYFDHSVCLYDVDLKVPLIFRFPNGENAGKRFSRMAQLVDIFPSVLEYLGMTIPGKTDGLPLMRQVTASEDLSQSHPAISAIFEGEIQGGKSLLSIRTPKHKYIRISPWYGDRLIIPGQEEFYDLIADPEENRNLADSKPDLLDEYRSVAKTFWNAWFLTARDTADKKRLSDQDIHKLHSLGYIQ